MSPAPPTSLSLASSLHALSSKLYVDLSSKFDSRYGGFGQRGAKFPTPAQTLEFLTTYAVLAPAPAPPVLGSEAESSTKPQTQTEVLETQKHAAAMAIRTLKGIWAGGIRDHVGGGVARYSVDERVRYIYWNRSAQLNILFLMLVLGNGIACVVACAPF